MKKETHRGWDALIGMTIVKVDTSAINQVLLHTESGFVLAVDANDLHVGIPVIELNVLGKKDKK